MTKAELDKVIVRSFPIYELLQIRIEGHRYPRRRICQQRLGFWGLVGIMAHFKGMEWVESIGHVLLHPKEFAADLIKRTREGEDGYFATEMLLCGDTARYFSLIEPADKEWLMKMVEEQENVCAIYCLLYGMHHKFKYWTETFVDEDTNEEMKILRYDVVEGSTFEKKDGEEERLIQIVMEKKDRFLVEELTKLCSEIDDNQELLLERIEKGDEEAAIYINDPIVLKSCATKVTKRLPSKWDTNMPMATRLMASSSTIIKLRSIWNWQVRT